MPRAENLVVNRTEEHFGLCNENFFSEAEKEMAAFLTACQELYGTETGQLGAEYWIEELNKLDRSTPEGSIPRQATIAAASRLARNARPVVVSRNHGPKNKAPKTQLPRLQLVNEQILEMLDSSTPEYRQDLHWPGDYISEPEPPEVTECMIDGLSHDIRNHLCAVFANVELMSQSTTSQTAREELLEDVHSAIRSSIDILDSLLLPPTTGQTHNFRSHSLNQLIAHVVKMVRIHPDARKAELSFANHPNLEVFIDSRELGRAVYNLLLNACQAVRAGSEHRRIQIKLCEERTSIQIQVIDNGPGVPEAIRQTLGKSLSSADRRQSIGLGLTIARRAAHEHGGFLELEESTMGKTVFVLHLSKAKLRPIGWPCIPTIAHKGSERVEP
jgi:signal transduction histidine kinase